MKKQNHRKIAMVTGASRGIGREIAIKMSQNGYDISFCYKSSSHEAEKLKHEIEKMDTNCFMMQCDVSENQEAKEYIKQTVKKLGVPDVTINNAGITRDNHLVMMDEKDWKIVIKNNLNSVYNVCKSVVFELIKKKRGCIINMSSISGVFGNATQTNYSASKAGIIGFSKALAKEVGTFGIRVNVVAPGFIKTDMTKNISDKKLNELKKSIPLNRIGHVTDVTELIYFLASDKSSYITGQTIQVDGGMVL